MQFSPDLRDRVADGTAFGDPFVLDGVEIPVTTSIGAKLSSDGNEAPDTLIRDADAAMYRAKQAGRARYQIAGEAEGRTAG